MNAMSISNTGIDLIKNFETLECKAYLCPAGVWTVGWGTTFKPDGKKVTSKDEVTEKEALEYLKHDISDAEKTINMFVSIELTQNEFDALVSFVYNIGRENFRTSTLLKRLNNNDLIGIAIEFTYWVHGGGKVLPGLVARRNKERELFMKQ